MKVHVMVFWVVTPCSDVVGFQRFGGPCCLHPQGEVNDTVKRVIGRERSECEKSVFGNALCLYICNSSL